MKKIVFLGNCQGRRLEVLYNEKFSPMTGDTAEFVASFEQLTPRVRQTLAEADVIVAQAIDSEHEIGLGKFESKAQVIEFPNVTGMFLWPYGGQPHIHNQPLPHFPNGPYGMQLGDRWLDKRIKAGTDPDTIVAEYEALDVAKAVNLNRMYDLVMERARQRDQRTGFALASLIESTLAEEPLFMTPANFELRLFKPLAMGVYQQLGFSSKAINDMLDTLWRTPFPIADLPIHPSVARHFRLKYVSPETRYRTYTGERLTFREWISRYVRYEWNDNLLEGTYRAHRSRGFDAEAQAALDKIEAGLAKSTAPVAGEANRAQARLLHLKGDRAGAIAALRRAIAVDDTDPVIIGTLSIYLSEQGHFGEAERLGRRVVNTWPHHADGWSKFASVLIRRGKLPEALAAVTRAIEIEPRNVELSKQLAFTLSQMGQTDRAREVLTTGIAMSPERPELYGDLARLLTKSGDLDGALVVGRRAVALNPTNMSWRLLLAEILFLRNDLVSAVVVLREAVTLDPQQTSVTSLLTRLLAQLGRREEAIAEYRRAVALDPRNAHLRHQLAQNLIAQGSFAEAEEVFAEAIAVDPANEGLHAGLVSVLHRQSRFDEAEAAARRAIAIKPGLAQLHHQLGDVLAASGNLPAAEEAYREAIALRPDNADAFGALALLAARQERLTEGLSLIEQAMALSPGNPHLMAKQGYLLMRSDELAKARGVLEAAIATAPDLAGLYFGYGTILERQGELSAALASYQTGIRLEPENLQYRRQLERLANSLLHMQNAEAAE